MLAIRGATTIENNDSEEIKNNSIELFAEIINRNNVKLHNIKVILFSCTRDVTKAYPGKYVREHFNLNKAAILHFNEMYVEDSLEMCIRVLLLVEDNSNEMEASIKDECNYSLENIMNLNDASNNDAIYVYLRNAKKLRNDLINH